MTNKGRFIVIDGMDGAGKSTQINAVKAYYERMGRKVYVTREPGGSVVAEQIRSIFKSIYDEVIHPVTEMYLLLAARNQHLESTVKDKLDNGWIVISDRYEASTYAYQLFGRKMNPVEFFRVWDSFQSEIQPDVTILLDLPPEKTMQRICMRGGAFADRFDAESLAFFTSVREGFLDFRSYEGRHYPISVVDANKSIEEVTADLMSKLEG